MRSLNWPAADTVRESRCCIARTREMRKKRREKKVSFLSDKSSRPILNRRKCPRRESGERKLVEINKKKMEKKSLPSSSNNNNRIDWNLGHFAPYISVYIYTYIGTCSWVLNPSYKRSLAKHPRGERVAVESHTLGGLLKICWLAFMYLCTREHCAVVGAAVTVRVASGDFPTARPDTCGKKPIYL